MYANAATSAIAKESGSRASAKSTQKPIDDDTSHNPIDIHVGRRIRLRRTLLGMSQEKLGEALGLTFQQVQKYERGTNRVSASRLYVLQQVLDVPISFFFDDLPDNVKETIDGGGPDKAGAYPESEVSRQSLEMMRAFARIRGVAVRKRLLDLTKALGGEGDCAAA